MSPGDKAPLVNLPEGKYAYIGWVLIGMTALIWHPEVWPWVLAAGLLGGWIWVRQTRWYHPASVRPADRVEVLEKVRQDLARSQAALAEREKMALLGQLTAGIAHEINNPINYVSNSVKPLQQNITEIRELLSKYRTLKGDANFEGSLTDIRALESEMDLDLLWEEVFALLRGLEEGTDLTKTIVHELKDFSRKDDSQPEPVDVHHALDAALLLLQNKVKHTAQVIKDYAPGLQPVMAEPGKIKQVLMNLLDNAIQAVEVGGEIRISTDAVKGGVRIRISDNGKGIEPQDLPHIFEPFFTTKAPGLGTGLGLYISQQIVAQYQGHIEAKSEPGAGTTFALCLPYGSDSLAGVPADQKTPCFCGESWDRY